MNYDTNKDFVIDFDNVWKWCGFARKGCGKRILYKNFIIDINYKVQKGATTAVVAGNENSKTASHVGEAVFEKMNGGQNKETILLTVNTFKKFCLKAGTSKADEIHEYYLKLEELLHETLVVKLVQEKN